MGKLSRSSDTDEFAGIGCERVRVCCLYWKMMYQLAAESAQ